MFNLFLFLLSFFFFNSIQCETLQQIMTDQLEDYCPKQFTTSGIITQNEQGQLDFKGMLSALNRTQTLFGSWGLGRLTNPTSKKTEIEAAQKRLRLLLGNSELFDRITSLLSEIQKGQRSLFTYYSEHSRLRSDVQALYYYYTPGSRRLNQSKLALDVSYLLSYSALVGNKVLIFGVMDQMTKVAMTGDFAVLGSGISLGTLFGNPIRSNVPWLVQLKDKSVEDLTLFDAKTRQGMCLQPSFGDRALLIRAGASESYQKAWQKSVATAVGVGALTIIQVGQDVTYAVQAHSTYDRIKFLWRIMTKLKQTVAQLARVMRAADKLAELIRYHPELAQWEPLKPLVFLLQGTDYWSENVQSLCELLCHSTFNLDKSNYWYSRGQVLLAHKEMKEVRDDLWPLWSSLGYLDAQMSIARLYKEHQGAGNQFCFVDLSEQATPLMLLKDFWFPLTYGESIVVNSIGMGYSGSASKLVLTGPNGGGKSTVMKSVCWLVLLGQSWGIVPASSATISLFTGLKTSLNSMENVATGLSTFMSEKLSMAQIESFIDHGDIRDCVFIALDEPYSGTVEVEAADRVCEFCEDIASDNRVALLLATHLEAPTYLEQQTNSFANYQMEFAEEDNGDVVRTFKLIPGSAQWWFNDPIKRKKIIESLGV